MPKGGKNMAKLEEILINSCNSVLNAIATARGTTNPAALWSINQFLKLKAPFNEREPVNNGELYENSIYYYEGMRNQINPSSLVRKALYKVLYELGYCYVSPSEDEEWIGMYDGNIDECNELIDGKKPLTVRYIHMHLKNGKIVGACVSDIAGDKPLAYGANGHSGCGYLFAQIIRASEKLLGEVTYKEFEAIKEKFVKKDFDKEFLQRLTIFENDILIDIAQSIEEPRREYILESSEKMLEDAKTKGEKVFNIDEASTSSKMRSSKPKITLPKAAMSIKDVADKGLYAISHAFNGDEHLVPTEYDGMEFSPIVEEVCGIVKASKSLPYAFNMNFLFTGEAGTGKSTASGQIARVLNLPRRIITCSKGMEEFRITQRLIPNPKKVSEADADFVYVDSEIVEAFKNGGIIEVQEANTLRDGVITALNAALDDSGELHLYDGSIIKRHPDCIFIFSMNVGYEGTKNMNQSFISRCTFKEEFTLPENEILVKRLVGKYKVEDSLVTDMVKAFMDVRQALEESGDTDGVCSYRELAAWVEALVLNREIMKQIPSAPELSVYEAAKRTLVPSCAPKDADLRAELEGVVAKYFASK